MGYSLAVFGLPRKAVVDRVPARTGEGEGDEGGREIQGVLPSGRGVRDEVPRVGEEGRDGHVDREREGRQAREEAQGDQETADQLRGGADPGRRGGRGGAE